MAVGISLSLLEYESELSRNQDNLFQSRSAYDIERLVKTGSLYALQLDIMRPPFIASKYAFSMSLVSKLCAAFSSRIALEAHLMARDPLHLVEQFNGFISRSDHGRLTVTMHREAYDSEREFLEALREVKSYGYRVGAALDLPTPTSMLTDGIADIADVVLLMCVPMGRGAQQYDERSTEKIREIANRFPSKSIEVDGGINEKTAGHAVGAGAKILTVGSFITKSQEPLEALRQLQGILGVVSGTEGSLGK